MFCRAQAIAALARVDRELVLGWALLIGFLGLGFAIEIAGSGAAHDCEVNMAVPFASRGGEVAMTVRQGRSCAMRVHADHAEIDGLRLVTLPHQGTVTERGKAGVVYHATRNSHGDDAFDLELHGTSDRHAFTSTIRVAVTVAEE